MPTKKLPADADADDASSAQPWGTPLSVVQQPLPDDDEEAYELTQAEKLAARLSTVSDDAKAYVGLHRIKDGNSHKLSWCKDYPVSEFESGGLGMIRAEWGPGTYQVRVYGTTRGGTFGLLAKEDITIEADPRAALAPPPAVAQQQSDLTRAIEVMMAGQQQILRQLAERPPAPDPMAQMATMVGVFAQIRQAFGPDAGGGAKLSETLATIRELKNVAGELAPPPDDSGGLLPIAGQIMELVRASTQQQGASVPMIAAPPSFAVAPPVQPIPRRRAAASPQPQPIPLPPQPHQEPPAMTPTQLQALQANAAADPGAQALLQQLHTLVTMAEGAKPAEEGAAIIYEVAPDEVIDLMRTPQWFDMLAAITPAVRPHEAWFREAHRITMAWLAEDEAEESGASDTGGPGAIPTAP